MTVDHLGERLLFLGIVVLACLMPAQNDTWWHLRTGQDILATRHVLMHDTFSHSVFGQRWDNHAWLSQVIFATVHGIGGLPLLTVTCALAVTAGMWLVYASTPGDRPLRLALVALVVAGATITWSLRPQAFTLLLVGTTIWCVSRERWTPLPVLFLVWANLHSAVGLGLVLLAGAAAGHLIARRFVPTRLVLVMALSAVATLMTPQGLAYWPNIAASMERSHLNTIAEWRRPDWPPAHLAFWAAAAGLPALALARRRRLTTSRDWGHVCGALLLLPFALSFMRNISPFLMAAAPAAGALLSGSSRRKAELPVSRSRHLLHAAVLASATLAATLVVARTWRSPPARMGWHPMSPGAARAIEGCRAALYNTYADGGPIIFFAPKQRVLLDSRQDPYPVSLVQAEGDVERTGEYRALFQEYGINCAAVSPAAPIRDRLERDGWIRRFADDQWVVLERPG
jgi:hypothetical protein